jgi:hypothetical protein
MLVVRIRLRDHRLIDVDGRYVAYHMGIEAGEALMTAAGFDVEVTETVRANRHGPVSSRAPQWATLFGRKRDNS